MYKKSWKKKIGVRIFVTDFSVEKNGIFSSDFFYCSKKKYWQNSLLYLNNFSSRSLGTKNMIIFMFLSFFLVFYTCWNFDYRNFLDFPRVFYDTKTKYSFNALHLLILLSLLFFSQP